MKAQLRICWPLVSRLSLLLFLFGFYPPGRAQDATNQFTTFLKNKFAIVLPTNSHIEHIFATNSAQAFPGNNPIKEVFARVQMSPTHAQTLKKEIISQKRLGSHHVMWEDKDSTMRIGFIPGPERVPVEIVKWWPERKGTTLMVLDDTKSVLVLRYGLDYAAVVIFMDEESGTLWFWTTKLNNEMP